MSETGAICVYTTTETEAQAESIASALVDRRLAACVQVQGPIRSTYRWQEEVEHAKEWLCAVKTRREAYARVEAAIRSLHSYDEPEIIAIPVVAGSAGYLAWLQNEVRDE
jgi:periplasmic divalent cation tolerance protein